MTIIWGSRNDGGDDDSCGDAFIIVKCNSTSIAKMTTGSKYTG